MQAEVADRNTQVFGALVKQGFKERACRAALDRCASTLDPGATLEELLRAALLLLTSA